MFYSDLEEEESLRWQQETRPHSLAAFLAKSTGASWKDIPTSYLLCEDDLAIPKEAQEGMTQAVRDLGGDIEVTRIKSSHSPFLSCPDTVVEWIRGAAGESV